MNDKTAYNEYCALLRELHILIEKGEGDSEEAWALTDRMDAPWYAMTNEQQDAASAYSVQLYREADEKRAKAGVTNPMTRAVLLDPKDINARLVLADWWEEYGTEKEQARAHYVRSSIDYPQGSFAALIRKGSDPFALLGLVPGSAVPVGVPGHQEQRTWMWSETDKIGLAVHDLDRKLSYRVDDGFVSAVLSKLENFTEDIARMLFSLHPVTKVVLTDRRPVAGDDSRQFVWAHHEKLGPGGESESSSPGYLPRHLFDLLLPDPKCVRVRDATGASFISTREYRKEKHARDALSRACISWGRSLVGLPEL